MFTGFVATQAELGLGKFGELFGKYGYTRNTGIKR